MATIDADTAEFRLADPAHFGVEQCEASASTAASAACAALPHVPRDECDAIRAALLAVCDDAAHGDGAAVDWSLGFRPSRDAPEPPDGGDDRPALGLVGGVPAWD